VDHGLREVAARHQVRGIADGRHRRPLSRVGAGGNDDVLIACMRRSPSSGISTSRMARALARSITAPDGIEVPSVKISALPSFISATESV